MSTSEELSEIRQAIFAMVNSLGAALPMTPDVRKAMEKLVEAEINA